MPRILEFFNIRQKLIIHFLHWIFRRNYYIKYCYRKKRFYTVYSTLCIRFFVLIRIHIIFVHALFKFHTESIMIKIFKSYCALHCMVLFCIELYRVELIILNCIVLFCIHCVLPYSFFVLLRIVLLCVVCGIVLYCIVMYGVSALN